MRNKTKYTSIERYKYHQERDMACGRFGIKFGSPKHCYSSGFADAFHNIDNSSAETREFGNRSGFAYRQGLKRGERARKECIEKNGANAFLRMRDDIDFKKD